MNSPWCVPVTVTRATVLSPLGDQVLDVHPHVGERGQQGPEEVERPLLRGRETRPALVLDEVVRDQVAEPVDVSRADPLVGAPHRRSVVHCCPPALRDEADEDRSSPRTPARRAADGTQACRTGRRPASDAGSRRIPGRRRPPASDQYRGRPRRQHPTIVVSLGVASPRSLAATEEAARHEQPVVGTRWGAVRSSPSCSRPRVRSRRGRCSSRARQGWARPASSSQLDSWPSPTFV